MVFLLFNFHVILSLFFYFKIFFFLLLLKLRLKTCSALRLTLHLIWAKCLKTDFRLLKTLIGRKERESWWTKHLIFFSSALRKNELGLGANLSPHGHAKEEREEERKFFFFHGSLRDSEDTVRFFSKRKSS